MPLNQVHFINNTGGTVTFKLDLSGVPGPQSITRTVGSGGKVTDPIPAAWLIDTVLPTSDISGGALVIPLILQGIVTDPGLLEATAEAHTVTNGMLTTMGGANPSEQYLPTVSATRTAQMTEAESEEPPQASV